MVLNNPTSGKEPTMRFLASFTIANAAESQRRMREVAARDRLARGSAGADRHRFRGDVEKRGAAPTDL
jgi:hypothetical protein